MAKLEIRSGRARGAESVRNTAQSIDSKQPQAIPALKIKRSRKPAAIKAQVIAKLVQGATKTQIAQDLGMTRNTVKAIADESDIERHLAGYQQQSVDLVPLALKVMRVRLQANSENAAIKTLESTIWPLTDKKGKGQGDQGIVLAIQNLMGNVQVNENKAVEPVSVSSPSTIAVPDNGAIEVQVIENK